MGKNANFVSHKKSKLKENGGPKLPLAADLVEGEIAINFGKDVETLSIKNESGDVVTFSSDNYYTEKKLGSGFTGENSARTVTDAIVNADWDETDETSGAFILNKPFGEICTTDYKTYFDGEVSLSSDDSYYVGGFTPTSGVELKYGDICRVTIDNTEYEVKVVKCDPPIGNEFLALNIEDGATEFEPTDWGIMLPGEDSPSGYFYTTGSVESVDLKIELSPYTNVGGITGTLEKTLVQYHKALSFPLEYEPKYGDTCIVTIDGVSVEKEVVKGSLGPDYEFLAINIEEGSSPYASTTWAMALDNGYCTYILYDSGDTATTTTIGIVKFGNCEIKKIDSKYLDIETCCWDSTDDGGVIQKDGNNTAEYHAVAEGFNTTASYMSHAEGDHTTASGDRSHAEGRYTTASGQSSHAEGSNTTASGDSSHAEGTYTTANGEASHAEGQSTTANGNNSHAEGYLSKAYGYQSHAEGQSTRASGSSSHAEGSNTKAIGEASHAEGGGAKLYNEWIYSEANGENSHAEGTATNASGKSSHAEGFMAQALGEASHAEGAKGVAEQRPTAYGFASHVEGIGTVASGNSAHAEGTLTQAMGGASHAEGDRTVANGEDSHAEGIMTVANGDYSHAEGYITVANNQSEHASGQYNISISASTTFGNSGNTLFSVGNGTADNARHNAFEIRQNGDIYIVSGGTDILLQNNLGGNIEIDQVIDSGTSASTNAVATKAVVDKLIEDEQVWAISLNELNNNKFGYAEFDNNSKSIEFYKDSDEASSGAPISTVDLSSFSIDIDQVIDSGTSASTDAVSTSAVYGFVTSYTPSITVDQDFSNTASTNPISTKAVYSAVTENELVLANTFIALSGAVSSHTENTDIHVTAADKTAWNAKLDASAYTPTDLSNYYTKSETSGATEISDALGGKVNTSDVITAITPSNSGSTDPIATKIVAENELTVSNALTDLDNRKLNISDFNTYSGTVDTAISLKASESDLTAHTASTVHMNNTEKTNLDSLATNIGTISGITSTDKLIHDTMNRRIRTNFTSKGLEWFKATLKSAIADQSLEKYGLKVGDYCSATHDGKTYNYVIAGLNTMKGTHGYRLTIDHVGIIVDTNDTHAWNTSRSTTTSQNTHLTGGTWTTGSSAAGYASCDLQYYLETTVLPNVEIDLGNDNIKSHYKLYSTAVNTSGYNRFGSPGGCSSSWAWYADQKICALSEIQVYGSIVWSSSGYDTGEACRQLDVFRVYNMNEIFEGRYPWLRDVASSSYACYVSDAGFAGYYTASIAFYVAALILFA